MKVVYISNKPIYPLVDGGCVAMNQFLKSLLNSGLDVKHFTVSTYKHLYKEENYPEKLNAIIRTESAFIDTRINPFSALSYLFKKGSYNIDRFKSQRFYSLLKNYLKEQKIDIVIFLATFFLIKKGHLSIPYAILIMAPLAIWYYRPRKVEGERLKAEGSEK